MSAGMPTGLFIAFVVALGAIAVLRRSALATLLVDRPNDRSLHSVPTPRVGGIGILAGALPVAAAFAPAEAGWIALVVAVVAIVSAVDDAKNLPVAVRLAVHLAAAAMVVAIIGSPAGGIAGAIAAVFVIAWMANLYNFMDGADGLAGGMAVVGYATLAAAAQAAGAPDLAMFAGAVSAASLAFLAFNFPPARVFMGDAGSVPLGFLAGTLGWQGVVRDLWPAWFPALVFSPFIVDATVTLARRLLSREAVWKAHRSHYYQRLVLGGWSHRRLAVAAWILMAAVAASAVFALGQRAATQGAIIFFWAIAHTGILVAIDRFSPREPS